jgi:hypothetical protein
MASFIARYRLDGSSKRTPSGRPEGAPASGITCSKGSDPTDIYPVNTRS